MTRCIYCTRTLVEGASDGSQPSFEHVVQYAAGGSDGCATTDACNRCNSDLGHAVDADFLRLAQISIARLTHSISGQSGAVPDWVLRGSSVATGDPGEIRFAADDTVEVNLRPSVQRSALPGGLGETLSISGSTAEARKIASGILGKAKKTGKVVWTASGKQAATVEDLLADAVATDVGEFKGQFVHNEHHAFRGIIKIAFGFAHLVFGPGWTFSPRADPLRAVINGSATFEQAKALLMGARVELRDVFLNATEKANGGHLLAAFPITDGTIVVSLFGDPSLTFGVKIGAIDDGLTAAMIGRNRIVAVIDPTSRKTRWIPVVEGMMALAGLGQNVTPTKRPRGNRR